MINIQDIIPFMKDGWVAMDRDTIWYWYSKKPIIVKELLQWQQTPNEAERIGGFDIAPADDWTKSLIQIKGVKTR